MYERFGRAEKLMMRVRSLKWHASTAQSADDAAAREEAGAIVAALTAIETAARAAASEDSVSAWEKDTDALAFRLSLLGPRSNGDA